MQAMMRDHPHSTMAPRDPRGLREGASSISSSRQDSSGGTKAMSRFSLDQLLLSTITNPHPSPSTTPSLRGSPSLR